MLNFHKGMCPFLFELSEVSAPCQNAVCMNKLMEGKKNEATVPLMDHAPTVHLQKTCTGALLRAGPELPQNHYGLGESKRMY